jgi:hypothetical protein
MFQWNFANKHSVTDPQGWKVLFILFYFLGTPISPKHAGMHVWLEIGELHVPSGMFSCLRVIKSLGHHFNDLSLSNRKSLVTLSKRDSSLSTSSAATTPWVATAASAAGSAPRRLLGVLGTRVLSVLSPQRF